jgi:hypothetical protein
MLVVGIIVIVVVVYAAVQTTKKREQAKNDELKERLLIQARNFAFSYASVAYLQRSLVDDVLRVEAGRQS